ncbi:helix-turn-helix domain-containing protein [Paraburkholderia sp. SIMBA_054]|uniref:helix-turn-helix domain-containing protein n=1 Tax=Paraburkholderia sp. SIMBA_054 TaxID=3085795 RepID=UPI00397E5AE2
MLNDFGKMVRQLRIEQGLLLKHMADALELSSAQLSDMEVGRKPLTAEIGHKAVAFFAPLVESDRLGQLRAVIDATLAAPGAGVHTDAGSAPSRLVAAFSSGTGSDRGGPEEGTAGRPAGVLRTGVNHPPEWIIADYATSQDYRRLAVLARTASIICTVDYHFRDVGIVRDVGRTQYALRRDEEIFEVSARGIGYVYAFGEDEFVALCAARNIEFIEPRRITGD